MEYKKQMTGRRTMRNNGMLAKLGTGLALLLTLCLGLCMSQVQAQGTAAGSSVSNGGDGGVVQSADQAGDSFVTWNGGGYLAFSSTGVVVSTGYGLTALNAPADQSLAVGASVYFGYNFKNMANAFDTFGLSTSNVAGGLNSMIVTILRDDNQNGSYDSGENTVITSTGLAAETTGYFLVRVFAPNGTADGSSVTYRVTVKDQGGAGTEDNWPSAGNDSRVDDATATVSGAIITLAKGIALSTDTRPGGFVTYVATITNSGSGSATSVVFKDKIPANATYDSGSITMSTGGSDTAKTDAVDGDEADFSSGVITVNVGTIANGSKAIVKFRVKIN